MQEPELSPALPEGAVHLRVDNSIAVLTLSHPQALNALTWAMYDQLNQHLETVAQDDAVRVVVLRGDAHRAFSVGADISQFTDFPGEDAIAYVELAEATVSHLWHMPKPTLVAIEGYAVGGGFGLAAACDLRYANSRAKLGIPVARTLGNCLSFGNHRRLAAILGEMKLKELLFTARLMDAEEALRAGFLTAVFSNDGFWPAVEEVARGIAANAPLTIWATKTALVRLEEARVGGVAQVPFADVIQRVYGSNDFQQAVLAHKTKTPPVWQGR